MSDNTRKYKDSFALFDKKGSGKVAISQLGDMLRAVGQNPTLKEISELESSVGRDGSEIDFDTYVKLINREGGFKKAGQPEDYIKAFQIFDKDLSGYIGVGELKYILTTIGEKLQEDEVDELLKGIKITDDNKIDYVEFVKSILAQ